MAVGIDIVNGIDVNALLYQIFDLGRPIFVYGLIEFLILFDLGF